MKKIEHHMNIFFLIKPRVQFAQVLVPGLVKIPVNLHWEDILRKPKKVMVGSLAMLSDD
jgi:hypothetical protein